MIEEKQTFSLLTFYFKSLMLASLMLLGQFAFGKNPQFNRQYWELKIQVHQNNLKNKDEINFIPKTVIWHEEYGAILAPRPNPFVKMFKPDHPLANKSGMVNLPNIDSKTESSMLSKAKKSLKELN